MPQRMRFLILGLVSALTFTVVAAILLRVMPAPLRSTDALVIGAVATLIAMVVLFVGYMVATKQRDVFYKKRPKP